jgi:hypothetical protein
MFFKQCPEFNQARLKEALDAPEQDAIFLAENSSIWRALSLKSRLGWTVITQKRSMHWVQSMSRTNRSFMTGDTTSTTGRQEIYSRRTAFISIILRRKKFGQYLRAYYPLP